MCAVAARPAPASRYILVGYVNILVVAASKHRRRFAIACAHLLQRTCFSMKLCSEFTYFRQLCVHVHTHDRTLINAHFNTHVCTNVHAHASMHILHTDKSANPSIQISVHRYASQRTCRLSCACIHGNTCVHTIHVPANMPLNSQCRPDSICLFTNNLCA